MSKSQTTLTSKFSRLFKYRKPGLSPASIKIVLSGLALMVMAVSAGLAIAGWLMPLEAQPQNSARQAGATEAVKPVRVASLDGTQGISGVFSGQAVKKTRRVAQKTETIVPRQSGDGLNPYARVKSRKQVVLPSRRQSENQVPLAVPPPLPTSGQVDDGLAKLTDNVVSTLENLKKKEAESTGNDLAPATSDLRQAIQMLVNQATSKGKSSSYVKALIDNAITGRNAVPVALANSDGKLDTRLLLAAVLPKKTVRKVGNADGGYLAALENESRSTTSRSGVASQPVAKRTAPRKKRYVLVRKGDNLSEIAMRVYGDPLAFAKIYRANRKILANANTLSIGQRLYIPR